MELLEFCGIKDAPSWKAWALKNHPDRGGDREKFVLVKSAYEKHINKQSAPTQSAPAPAPDIWDNFKKTFHAPKKGQCEAMIDKGVGLHAIFIDGDKRRCVKHVKPGQKYCHMHSHIGTAKQCSHQENGVQCSRSGKMNGLCSIHDKK